MDTAAIDRDPYDTQHRRDLLVDIQHGLLVPVLGGDINLCGRPRENEKGTPINWEEEVDGTKSPPSTCELALHLLKQARQSKKLDPPMRELLSHVLQRQLCGHKDSMSAVGLANVCQYINFVDPTILETGLPRILSEEYRPTPVHDFLVKLAQYQPAGIPEDRPYPCIVTACFDHVLEQQLRKHHVPFHLLSFVLGDEGGCYRYTEPRERPENYLPLKPEEVEKLTFPEHAVVIKLNGGIPTATRNFAITEDHYIDYLTHHGVGGSLPKIVLAKLHKRQNRSHLLFLGYSPRHWNLRLILLRIWSEYLDKKNKSWTVILEKGFSEIDTKFWKQYRLEEDQHLLQIPSLDSYMNRLTEQLASLPGADRDRVFISYSHKDHKLFDELNKMLVPVLKERRIEIWTDKMILPGQLWQAEIEKALASAKAAILLVSPDYLHSDFIRKHELSPLLDAAREKGCHILWINSKPAPVDTTEIGKYQALYQGPPPLSILKGERRNRAILDIAQKIRDLLSEKA
jgi:hypothetical protein